MKRYEYLSQLEALLSALPETERRDALNYYEEYFDAAGPENEEATAAELGSPAEAARKILESEGLPAAEPQPPAKSRAGYLWIALIVLVAAALVMVLAVLMLELIQPGTAAESVSVSTSFADEEPQTETSRNPALTEPSTTESAAEAGSGFTTMQTSFARARAQDMTMIVDYGTVTIQTSDTVTEAELLCENVRTDWLTFAGEKQVRVTYKTPANYNLSNNPEPHFTLTVPTARSFTFHKLNITAVMGNVTFAGDIAAEAVTLNLDMGNFSGDTVTAGTLSAVIDMGTFELGKLNGAQTIAIENSMGNVGLTVDGGADEYSIDIQSDMGDTAFNGQTYPGGYLREKENARSLTVRTAMGNVAVTTENP